MMTRCWTSKQRKERKMSTPAVLERIERRVLNHPHAKAIVEHDDPASSRDDKEVSTTYGDLWEKSGRMAKALSRETRGAMIGVAVNEGSALHVCQVAVLRARKTFVPISIEEGNGRRLNDVCELCDFAAVVVRDWTQKQSLLEMLDESKRTWMEDRIVLANEPGAFFDDQDIGNNYLPPTSEEEEENDDGVDETFISHVFFTSGSTGVPKGCVVSERALFSYCVARNERFEIKETSRVFMASSSTFDPSYGDALSCFDAGGTLHVGKTKAATFEHLGVLLGKSKAHFCALTPSLASTISDSDLQAIQNPLLITLGGERASANLLEKLINSTNIKVANTYGVTECAVYQTFGVIRDASDSNKIGKPLDGISIVLVRGDLNSTVLDSKLDRGKIGEIYITGAQVGEGYYKDEQLTCERFIVYNNKRYFRTGDFAKYEEKSGDLIFIGRKDSQVKINGVRIELEEVESLAMAACKGFVNAIAACALSKSELLLFCCISEETLSDGTPLVSIKPDLIDAIRWCISKTLPKSMRPKQIFILDDPTLPLSANGKIDRRLLLSNEYMGTFIAEKMTNLAVESKDKEMVKCESNGEEDSDNSCLETPLDFAIADAWHSALNHDEPGDVESLLRLNSNFVFMGGDSLGALSAVRKLKSTLNQISRTGLEGTGSFGEDFGVLSPHELLQRPVLQTYASYLASKLDLPETWTDRKKGKGNDTEVTVEYELSLVRSLAKSNLSKALEAILKACQSERKSIRDDTVVCLACQLGHTESLDILLKYGVAQFQHCRGARNANLLHCAVRNPTKAKKVREILAALSSGFESALAKLVQSEDDDGQTPLHAAARYGASRALIGDYIMFSRKPDVLINARDGFKRTPLHWACVNGFKPTVMVLLEFGADKSLKDTNGETALDCAERRALCASNQRIPGERPSKWADIATVLGGGGSTKHLKAKGIKK